MTLFFLMILIFSLPVDAASAAQCVSTKSTQSSYLFTHSPSIFLNTSLSVLDRILEADTLGEGVALEGGDEKALQALIRVLSCQDDEVFVRKAALSALAPVIYRADVYKELMRLLQMKVDANDVRKAIVRKFMESEHKHPDETKCEIACAIRSIFANKKEDPELRTFVALECYKYLENDLAAALAAQEVLLDYSTKVRVRASATYLLRGAVLRCNCEIVNTLICLVEDEREDDLVRREAYYALRPLMMRQLGCENGIGSHVNLP